MMFSETVTLRRATNEPGMDRYNRPLPGPSVDVDVEAWFEPRESSEDTAAAEQYVSGYWLYLPLAYAGALTAADAVILPHGLGEFEVKGQPGLQPSGVIVEGYVRAALDKVTG